jgi:hypothetical protein
MPEKLTLTQRPAGAAAGLRELLAAAAELQVLRWGCAAALGARCHVMQR